MPSAGRAKKQRRTVLFKLSKVAATRKKKKKESHLQYARFAVNTHVARSVYTRLFRIQSARARKQHPWLWKPPIVAIRRPSAHVGRIPAFQSTHMYTQSTDTRTNTQTGRRSFKARAHGAHSSLYHRPCQKWRCTFFFVSVLKSGETAPLTSLGGRQHLLADPLSKRCFETTLKNTLPTVLRIFTSLTGVIEGVTEARESY